MIPFVLYRVVLDSVSSVSGKSCPTPPFLSEAAPGTNDFAFENTSNNNWIHKKKSGNINSSGNKMNISVSDGASTLLELLRHTHDPFQELLYSQEKTMLLIIRHQSEFPVKIREAIHLAANAPERTPEWFVVEVYNALKVMLLCKPEKENTKNENIERPLLLWNGLDSAVDTEEEVEVAIRVFPDVLKEYRDGSYPIFWLASCLKALPFIPLLAELGI
jgi:hypothetical protein